MGPKLGAGDSFNSSTGTIRAFPSSLSTSYTRSSHPRSTTQPQPHPRTDTSSSHPGVPDAPRRKTSGSASAKHSAKSPHSASEAGPSPPQLNKVAELPSARALMPQDTLGRELESALNGRGEAAGRGWEEWGSEVAPGLAGDRSRIGGMGGAANLEWVGEGGERLNGMVDGVRNHKQGGKGSGEEEGGRSSGETGREGLGDWRFLARQPTDLNILPLPSHSQSTQISDSADQNALGPGGSFDIDAFINASQGTSQAQSRPQESGGVAEGNGNGNGSGHEQPHAFGFSFPGFSGQTGFSHSIPQQKPHDPVDGHGQRQGRGPPEWEDYRPSSAQSVHSAHSVHSAAPSIHSFPAGHSVGSSFSARSGVSLQHAPPPHPVHSAHDPYDPYGPSDAHSVYSAHSASAGEWTSASGLSSTEVSENEDGGMEVDGAFGPGMDLFQMSGREEDVRRLRDELGGMDLDWVGKQGQAEPYQQGKRGQVEPRQEVLGGKRAPANPVGHSTVSAFGRQTAGAYNPARAERDAWQLGGRTVTLLNKGGHAHDFGAENLTGLGGTGRGGAMTINPRDVDFPLRGLSESQNTQSTERSDRNDGPDGDGEEGEFEVDHDRLHAEEEEEDGRLRDVRDVKPAIHSGPAPARQAASTTRGGRSQPGGRGAGGRAGSVVSSNAGVKTAGRGQVKRPRPADEGADDEAGSEVGSLREGAGPLEGETEEQRAARLEHRRDINRRSAQKHRLRRKQEVEDLTRQLAERDARIRQLEREVEVERARVKELRGFVAVSASGAGRGGGSGDILEGGEGGGVGGGKGRRER